MAAIHTQFGTADSADFENNTWTFEMEGDFKVCAGKFAIVPIEEYSTMNKNGKEFQPKVLITEGELVALGLKKIRDDDFFIEYAIGLNPHYNDYLFSVKFDKDYENWFYRNGNHILKYVHQLKELYTALTQKEL